MRPIVNSAPIRSTAWLSPLASVFPDGVVSHWIAIDEVAPLPIDLLPAELRSSAPQRQREFAAGRACASAALKALDHRSDLPLGIGPDRAPLWPPGYCGSISHDAGIAVAVVARSDRYEALGLDLATVLTSAQATEVAGIVAPEAEVARLAGQGFAPELALTVLFSAREALYKCLAPGIGRYFDFLDVALDSVSAGCIGLRLMCDLAPQHPSGNVFHVRYCLEEGRALCGIAIPAFS